jgi:hypothetical protein
MHETNPFQTKCLSTNGHAVNLPTDDSNRLEAVSRERISQKERAHLTERERRPPKRRHRQWRFIMIRASTLLPAFILAFGLAGASLTMAADSSSSSAKQAQPAQGHSAKAADTSCNNAPMYERPYYCQAHGG